MIGYSHEFLYSYGLAVIALSLAVNFLLIPFYNITQKWQKEDSEAQQRMAEKKAEITKVYQGKERFMMLKALYKQHHYHPIMQLKSSCGLLIQIPFFIAAYELLTQVMPLHGQAFGRIADLGAPDGLFHLGAWSINVLPILMTLISLLSVFFYTEATSQSEKTQLYGVTLFFLIILYSSPSSLVLYWTINNAFSLGRIILNWLEKTSKPYYRKYEEAKHFIGLTMLFFSLLSLLVGSLLPEGLMHDTLLKTVPLYAWIPCLYALKIIYQVITKQKTLQKNKREPIELHDLSLVLLIMIPLAGFIAANVTALSTQLLEYILFALMSASVACIALVLLPHFFSHLISKKVLQAAILGILILLCYMPLIYEQNHNHLDTLKNTLSLVMGIFLLSCIIVKLNSKPLVLFFTITLFIHTLNNYEQEKFVLKEYDTSSFPKFKKKPNVYLLTYDAYVPQETMGQYGIDNTEQEAYLKSHGFTLYPHTYSTGNHSYESMSAVLNLARHQGRRPVCGKGLVPDTFKRNGYLNVGYFKSGYYYVSTPIFYDQHIPKQTVSGFNVMLNTLSIGFMDHLKIYGNTTTDRFIELKQAMLKNKPQQPRFVFTHTGPGHSQTPKRCSDDETEQFLERLTRANQEMKQDIETIEKVDPDAIIIVNGDHGPNLTHKCKNYISDIPEGGVTRLNIQDIYSSFLAIKMPHYNDVPQEKIRVLQDVFPEILNRLADTDKFDQIRMKRTHTSVEVITHAYVEDGIIHGGVNDGQPLFMSKKR